MTKNKKTADPKNQPFFIGDKIELFIDSLSFPDGHGVGRHQKMVIFVPQTAPGDLVKVQISRVKKNFAEAKALQVLKASEQRRAPLCPIAYECGGCVWQHVAYEEQLHQKQKILENALAPLKSHLEASAQNISPSPKEYGYRNRIQVHLQGQKLGFRRQKSHEVVDVEKCFIAEEKVNEKLNSLRQSIPDLKEVRFEIALKPSGSIEVRSGKRAPKESHFSQVNSHQNSTLLKKVQKLSEEIAPSHILDLYCGNGNLTQPLAVKWNECSVVGVELSQKNVSEARVHCKDLPNVQFEAADVAEYLQSLKPFKENTLVLLDPPRLGCDQKVLEELARLNPASLIYVSCNPMTFSRDLQRWLRLTAPTNWRLQWVEGLDMFPQTANLEVIGYLERKSVDWQRDEL